MDIVAALLLALAAQNAAVAEPPPLNPQPARRPQIGDRPPPPAAPPPRPQRRQPPGYIRMEGAREPLALVKSAVRAEAQRLYGRECGKVIIPDRAFMAVEITGASNPEYAVLFGRATCTKMAQRWSGTGGPVVQFWYASDGPARMLLEHSMMGFTPRPTGLVSVQHGAACPNGAGPNSCVVSYRWNEKDRALEVATRVFIDGKIHRQTPRMRYGYEQISR